MAKFSGPVNLHLGVEEGPDGLPTPAWAKSEWDDDARTWVIDVSGDGLKRFRAVAEQYGFSEVKGS